MIPLAAVDPVSLLGLGWTILIAVLSSIGGGLVGGFLVGRKIGGAEEQLAEVKKDIIEVKGRLAAGDRRFDSLVELSEKAKMLGREIDALSGNLGHVVTEKVCEVKHLASKAIGDSAGRLVDAIEALAAAIAKATRKFPDRE